MTPIPSAKGIELMSKEKHPSKTSPEKYQFFVYVAERSGNSEQCMLHTKPAPPGTTTDSEEDVQDVVAVTEVLMEGVAVKGDAVTDLSPVSETLNHNCGEVGHLRASCINKDKGGDKAAARVTLAEDHHQREQGLLDPGQQIQRAPLDCDEVCRAANGGIVHVNKVGTVKLRTAVDGNEVAVDLSDVYYAETLMDNIISYGRLEKQGVFL
ncbi:hypothetical protein PHMEG_00021960 [Phytophthora megakarya]|uniref:Retrovirus-related Pol polyprotein from transposon TNT 1-94-like beta-barrel domain-containing protein n=1 Tax=Phytophthora megakarya TaxID=4795 RepID=A0A225VLI9_9STRA|nr:hypothetical protein PHMEG_00021960 [Phytophthora megakarya]